MIEIKPIEPYQVDEAKRMMLSVAEGIYKWGKPIDELVAHFEQEGNLKDLEDVQAHYFARRGIFLVALDAGRVIGSGAIRPIDENVCELKRMWLLEKYHGQGIGYRIIQQLLEFARETGYESIQLETGLQQERAINFYKRVGFQVVAMPQDAEDDVRMEMAL